MFKLRFNLLFAVLLGCTATITAQKQHYDIRKIRPDILNQKHNDVSKAKKEFDISHPLLVKGIQIQPSNSPFATVVNLKAFPTKHNGPLLSNINSSTTLWGNLTFMEGWSNNNHGALGYYSFNPTDPINYSSLFETSDRNVATHGVQYANGHLYGLTLDLSWSAYGIVIEWLYDTNTLTGETTYEELDDSKYLNLAAAETAEAADGTVYGEFYNSDGSAFEWGTVDYATKTRTTIGAAKNFYVALGITKEGQLYGVAGDGNLYKIDKTTGEETVVGPTGLTITTSDGKYYQQTGEIDQRDNTFYWKAFDSNGVGGLYTIDLETGEASLISNDNAQIYGMVIPQPEADDNAPAKVTDAVYDFEGGSLAGTISFTMPTSTFSGTSLSGDLDYKVLANDSVIASGSAEDGSNVSADVTLPNSGSYDFVITTSNSAGESPKAKLTKWIGYDTPKPVSNVSFQAIVVL